MAGRLGLDGRTAALFAVVLLGALLLRLGAVAATPHLSLASDPTDYSRLARSIVAGDGYSAPGPQATSHPTAFRPPAFPALVAAAFAASGNRVTAARLAQAVVGTIVVALIALLAMELFGRTEGLVAGGLAAIFPPLIIDGMTLLSEPLFVALVLGAILATLRWRRAHRLRWAVCAGVLIGLSILTRTPGVLVLLALAFAMRDGRWRTPRSYRAPAVLVAAALLVVIPWTIRNAVALDAFVPVSTQDGYTLAGTYNATSQARDGVWIVATIDPDVAQLVNRNRDLGEVELGSKLGSAARRFALDHPSYLLTVAGRNALRLVNLGGADYERQVAMGDYGLGPGWARVMTYGLFPFLLLALIGATTRKARAAPRWFWAIPVLLLSTVLVLATNRFRAPIDPMVIMLAALGVVRLAGLVRTPRPARAGYA